MKTDDMSIKVAWNSLADLFSEIAMVACCAAGLIGPPPTYSNVYKDVLTSLMRYTSK